MNMRQLTVALASACIFVVASCGGGRSSAPRPVAGEALDGLLLSLTEINSAMGATGMTVNGTSTDMSDDSANVPNKDCRFVYSAEASVYDGSSWTAVRSQYLREPADDFDHEVWQAVVSFPSANDAARFFAVSAQRWPACSNRQFHYIEPGQPDKVWTVRPIANTDGTLSATATVGEGWSCRRALTVSNNVAIDVAACSDTPVGAAVNIANQIDAKVPK